MIGVVAQLCGGSRPGHERLLDFEFFEAFACTYTQAVGLFQVGLLLYGAIGLAYYIRTGSPVLPMIVILVTGGVTATVIATPGVAVFTIALLGAGAGSITWAYYRFSR